MIIYLIFKMTTSSDEQWRIQKATNGKNGVNKQDSVDEEIDNSIDENAKNIEAKFENGILREIYNDGAPMNSNDRSNSLTLDGRSKSTKQNKKGKYGIGGFYSRCMLAGQGKQIITTKDYKTKNIVQHQIVGQAIISIVLNGKK